MENINNHNLHPQPSHLIRLMTSTDIFSRFEFLKIISSSGDLRKLAEMITSNLDLFVTILRIRAGSYRVLRMLGISDYINTILFYPILERFTKIMNHRESYKLGLKMLRVCNVRQTKLFCNATLSLRNMLLLSRSEYGCIVLKRVLAIADDGFKDDFLTLTADYAFHLSWYEFGISLIKHVLKLDFTHKTTQDSTRFHRVMAKFDEIFSNSDIAELHNLALMLTVDSKLFMDFVKTRRGSLMVQITLGKSEKIDMVFLKAIKQNLIDVITMRFRFGYGLVFRLMDVFNERGNIEVERIIKEEIAWKALYLIKDNDPNGSIMVGNAIDVHNERRTTLIASRLHGHYVKLSFDEYGSNVVEKLVGKGESVLALSKMVLEMVECDEDTLVRLAKDEYGNKVLEKTLEFAKKLRRANLLGDIVKKLKPILYLLRGSQGENIAALIVSETDTAKDRIVSEKNN